MRHGQYTRDEAIRYVGEELVNKLDYLNCEPTSRCQTDGDDSTEYSASIRGEAKDGAEVVLIAYYYTTPEQEAAIAAQDGDGSAIDWEIEGYEIEQQTIAPTSVREYLAAIGSKGGKAKTPAKSEAAKARNARRKAEGKPEGGLLPRRVVCR